MDTFNQLDCSRHFLRRSGSNEAVTQTSCILIQTPVQLKLTMYDKYVKILFHCKRLFDEGRFMSKLDSIEHTNMIEQQIQHATLVGSHTFSNINKFLSLFLLNLFIFLFSQNKTTTKTIPPTINTSANAQICLYLELSRRVYCKFLQFFLFSFGLTNKKYANNSSFRQSLLLEYLKIALFL